MHKFYEIPLFDLRLEEDDIQGVLDVLRTGWLTLGPKTLEFEREFSSFTKRKYALLTSSGTTALHLAYKIIGVKEGDEVIVPSFTFVATVSPLIHLGAKPVFCDIASPQQPFLTPENIKKLITKKTKAIVFVSYAGNTDYSKEIKNFTKEKGIYLIEDASHATGSVDMDGNPAGFYGDLSCFSLFSNKTLPVGEGGILVTDNEEFYELGKRLRSHGMTTLTWDRYSGELNYDVVELGFNFRASEIEASLGLTQLKKIRENVEKRRKLVAHYINLLKNLELPIEFINNPLTRSCHYIFPILLPNEETRDKLRLFLHKNRVQTSIHYPAVHLFSYFQRTHNTRKGELPVTEDTSKKILSLPLYPHLGLENVEKIVSLIKSFFYENRKFPTL